MEDLIARAGLMRGLHTGMGLAAKGMVVAVVVFTVLNVEFANGIYTAIRGWIEASLSWYYIVVVMGLGLGIHPTPDLEPENSRRPGDGQQEKKAGGCNGSSQGSSWRRRG